MARRTATALPQIQHPNSDRLTRIRVLSVYLAFAGLPCRVAVLGLDPEGQVPSLEIGSSAIGNVGNLVFYVAYDVPSFSWPYSVIRKV